MPFYSAGDGDLKTAFLTNAWLMERFVGGTLWSWGYNAYGTLGDNTNGNIKSSPVQNISQTVGWSQIAYGDNPSVAIKTDGTLWSWGPNSLGQLGDNTTARKSSPVQTVAYGTNWKQVSSKGAATAAIKTDGTLWLWGYNFYGELGDNTTTNRSSPVQTVAFGTNWKQVSLGAYVCAAIKSDGTLWNWGFNYYAQLGDSTTTSRSSPVQTVTSGTNWKQVSCGFFSTSAIKTDGTLWSWGNNGSGQLGDNTTTAKSSPVQTVAYGTNWKQVTVGQQSVAAIKTDGTLWSWGSNGNGQLGDNTTTAKSSPVQTVAYGTNWKQVSHDADLTAAVKNDGTLWLWGYNQYGQLGDNTTVNKSSPVQTVINGTNWKQAVAGNGFSAAVTFADI